jgi:hypothetical protein
MWPSFAEDSRFRGKLDRFVPPVCSSIKENQNYFPFSKSRPSPTLPLDAPQEITELIPLISSIQINFQLFCM